MANHNILYCFISHSLTIDQDIISIQQRCNTNNITDYIICYGNGDNTLDSIQHTIHLNCDDTYEGLPDKIYKLYNFLSKHLDNYDFYLKLDRTTKIHKKIDFINNHDYQGFVVPYVNEGNRGWHLNKCSLSSKWNNKLYDGIYVPWCGGGYGYILSNKALKIIANNPPNLQEEIYEDLYVAKTLYQYNIKPSNIDNLSDYLDDEEYKKWVLD